MQETDSAVLKRQIWQSSSVLAVRLIGGLAINVLGGILLARLLGPRAWGIYAISLFLLLSYQIVFEKGLVAYLIQKQDDLTTEEKRVSYTIQVGLGLLCLTASVLILAPLAERWFGYSELGPLIISSGMAGFAYSLRSVPLALLEREMMYLQVGLIELSDIIAFNAVAVTCVLVGLGVQGLVIGNISRGLVSATIAFALKERPGIAWDTQVARRIINFGLPVFGSNLLKIFVSAADPILLGTLATPQALGFVQVTYTLLNYPASVSAVLTRVSFSALARIQDQAKQLNQLSSSNIRVLSRVIIPSIAMLAGTGLIWVPWVYGMQWMPMAQTLLVAALPVSVGHVFLSLTASLYAKGRPNQVLSFLLIYGLVYWLASLALIPRWGQLGSPMALWVCAPVWLLLVRSYMKECGTLNLRPFFRILLISGLMMVVLALSIQFQCKVVATILFVVFFVWWLSNLSRILASTEMFLQWIARYTSSVRFLADRAAKWRT